MEKNKFYLYHRASNVRVLGPGLRYVIWTQGCKHNCKNCIAPDSHPLDKNGYWMSVEDIYQEIEKEFTEKNINVIMKKDGKKWKVDDQNKDLFEILTFGFSKLADSMNGISEQK